MADYEEAFEKYIAGQKAISSFEWNRDEEDEDDDDDVEYEGDDVEFEDVYNYKCFGIEFENGYKWVMNAEFDPQTSFILDTKNKIVATNDNWNK